MSSSRVEIDLLEGHQIGRLGCEKFRNLRQTESTVDVPIHDSDRLRWRGLPSPRRKVARQNVFHARLSRRSDVLGWRLETRTRKESAREVKGANPCEITPDRGHPKEDRQCAYKREEQEVMDEDTFSRPDMNLSCDL